MRIGRRRIITQITTTLWKKHSKEGKTVSLISLPINKFFTEIPHHNAFERSLRQDHKSQVIEGILLRERDQIHKWFSGSKLKKRDIDVGEEVYNLIEKQEDESGKPNPYFLRKTNEMFRGAKGPHNFFVSMSVKHDKVIPPKSPKSQRFAHIQPKYMEETETHQRKRQEVNLRKKVRNPREGDELSKLARQAEQTRIYYEGQSRDGGLDMYPTREHEVRSSSNLRSHEERQKTGQEGRGILRHGSVDNAKQRYNSLQSRNVRHEEGFEHENEDQYRHGHEYENEHRSGQRYENEHQRGHGREYEQRNGYGHKHEQDIYGIGDNVTVSGPRRNRQDVEIDESVYFRPNVTHQHRQEIGRRVEFDNALDGYKTKLEERSREPNTYFDNMSKGLKNLRKEFDNVSQDLDYTSRYVKHNLKNKTGSQQIVARGAGKIVNLYSDQLTELILDDLLYELMIVLQTKEEGDYHMMKSRRKKDILHDCMEALKDLTVEQRRVQDKAEESYTLASMARNRIKNLGEGCSNLNQGQAAAGDATRSGSVGRSGYGYGGGAGTGVGYSAGNGYSSGANLAGGAGLGYAGGAGADILVLIIYNILVEVMGENMEQALGEVLMDTERVLVQQVISVEYKVQQVIIRELSGELGRMTEDWSQVLVMGEEAMLEKLCTG